MNTDMTYFSNSEREEMFEFLDDLRESGSTNMVLAYEDLMYEFDLDNVMAKKVLRAWMDWKEEGN